MATPATEFPAGFERDVFEAAGLSFTLLRGRANGPVVILIHELAAVG